MADEKKDVKKVEEPCDPLVEDCDLVRSSVLERTKESAILDTGIKKMESALKELEEAEKIFEDETGGEAFKTEKETLMAKLKEAKQMKDECDGDCYEGIKKFNICKTTPDAKKN